MNSMNCIYSRQGVETDVIRLNSNDVTYISKRIANSTHRFMQKLDLLVGLTLSVNIPISEISRCPCKLGWNTAMSKVEVVNKLQR
jgi:hypothetical protein